MQPQQLSGKRTADDTCGGADSDGGGGDKQPSPGAASGGGDSNGENGDSQEPALDKAKQRKDSQKVASKLLADSETQTKKVSAGACVRGATSQYVPL